jgi:hypothetical protein
MKTGSQKIPVLESSSDSSFGILFGFHFWNPRRIQVLESPARSKVLPNENWFYQAKFKRRKKTGIKGATRKLKKPVAWLSYDLD